MAAQIEYDESGSTTYYFLLSIFGLLLLPLTYYLLPKKKTKLELSLACKCEGCTVKAEAIERRRPKSRVKTILKYTVLVGAWLLLFYMLYRVATMERTQTFYDPYDILGIDRSATVGEIKKRYRELSKFYHPDKETGDEETFMKIAKAYEALTDEESRKNWEEYGNPDGPRATTFGIALPSWIVDRKNSAFVLGLYVLVFMVALPTAIGIWWFRSVKYSTANILLSTQKLFFHFLAKMNNVPIKRQIAILTSAQEFTKEHSVGVKERPIDNIELPKMFVDLPFVNQKTKEPPFCAPYALKARILLHAHLTTLDLHEELKEDLYHILKITPSLVNEMVNILQQVWVFAQYQRGIPSPSVESFENSMRLSSMIVQGLWDTQSPFLQIPHVDESSLKHFRTKKRHIHTIEDLSKMKDTDRRSLLRTLSDEQYKDVLTFLDQFPHVAMEVDATVEDDEDVHKITAGSLVTVSVSLMRTSLLKHCGQSVEELGMSSDLPNGDVSMDTLPAEDELDGREVPMSAPEAQKIDQEVSRPKAWAVNKKKKKVTKSAKKISKHKKKLDKKTESPRGGTPEGDSKAENGSTNGGSVLRQRKKGTVEERSKNEGEQSSQEEDGDNEEKEEAVDDEEEEWSKIQKDMKKNKSSPFTEKSTDSHPVHCPNFPLDIQEGWWLYLVDKKTRKLVSPPQKIIGLKETSSVTAHFKAPPKKGYLSYGVLLRSDCYHDYKVERTLKLAVHESKVVETKQWEDLEKEEEEEEAFEETDEEGESEEVESDG